MNKKIFKSIGAIVAGFVTVVILSIGTDFLLESIGVFPTGQIIFTTWMLIVAFLYRSIYTIIGGYVTAKLSSNSMRDVIILGIIGTVAGIAGAIAGWNLSSHWYPIALAATGFLFTWIGGKLNNRRIT